MSNEKMTPGINAWPCPDCNGRGIVTERLQEFYHRLRTGRPVEDYCESCLMHGYWRSYWPKQSLTEAAQSMVEAFDAEGQRR